MFRPIILHTSGVQATPAKHREDDVARRPWVEISCLSAPRAQRNFCSVNAQLRSTGLLLRNRKRVTIKVGSSKNCYIPMSC